MIRIILGITKNNERIYTYRDFIREIHLPLFVAFLFRVLVSFGANMIDTSCPVIPVSI